MKKNFKGSQKAWDSILNNSLNIAIPYIVMAVAAKSKNPQVRQATVKNQRVHQKERF